MKIIVGYVDCQEAMEKAIKNKVAKAVVPAIDVMFQALRFAFFAS